MQGWRFIATVGAELEERHSLIWWCIWTHHSLQLGIFFFFWFRLRNNENRCQDSRGGIQRQCRSQNSQAGPCTVVSPIFHICFISSSYSFHWGLKSLAAAAAYLNRLAFLSLSTCHPSSSSSLLPYLGPPPFLPTPSSQFLFGIICQPFALAIKNVLPFLDTKRLGELGRLLSVSACVEIRRCGVCASRVRTDRHRINMIKRW